MDNIINFDKILNNHKLNRCPEFLWQIKVTDDEFQQLKELIKVKAKLQTRNCNNHLVTIGRECALYFAEYWKREYMGGICSLEMIQDSLDLDHNQMNRLYSSARNGLKNLHLQLLQGERDQYLYSLLLQGGGPLGVLNASEGNGGAWYRFFVGLINKNINFDELGLGSIASQSESLRTYCNNLIKALELDQFRLAPFYCENESNLWFFRLKSIAKQEQIRHRQQRPFSLDWEFIIDSQDRTVSSFYKFQGSKKLSQTFLDEWRLTDKTCFTIQILKNGQPDKTFDYINNFCSDNVRFKGKYSNEDNISVLVDGHQRPCLSDSLRMDVPRLLYRNQNGNYELGKRIGIQESFLLIPDGWSISADSFECNEYIWNDIALKGVKIPSDFAEEIRVTSKEDGCIIFGAEDPLFWTELKAKPLYIPEIKESVYNVSTGDFRLCSDNGANPIDCRAQFKNRWQREWIDTPLYGLISAKAIGEYNNFVTPINFINVGAELSVTILKADEEACQLRIDWPLGRVSTNEGCLTANNVWKINKKNCEDPRYIRFKFTPDDGRSNPFVLSVKAPFKCFYIQDVLGNRISNNRSIPYEDLDYYTYNIVGQDIDGYTYEAGAETVRRSLRWIEGNLYICEAGHDRRRIPYSSSLTKLFDSRAVLRAMLDCTSQNIQSAEINVVFNLRGGDQLRFKIKNFPYHIELEDNKAVIKDGDRHISYNDSLNLLNLNDLSCSIVRKDGVSGQYVLPDISQVNYLLVGSAKGSIWPFYITTSQVTNIVDILDNSTMANDVWKNVIGLFDLTQKYNIPASVLPDLRCLASSSKALVYFAFLLYCSSDDTAIMADQLIAFSDNLSFQWFWLQPYINNLSGLFQSFVESGNNIFNQMYIKWAWSKFKDQSQLMAYISALTDDNSFNKLLECFSDVLSDFRAWFEQLCIRSLKKSYAISTDDTLSDVATSIICNRNNLVRIEETGGYESVNNSQDILTEVDAFFNRFEDCGNLSRNERWLCRRVNSVANHLNGNIDLFVQNDHVKRSIIYASQSCNNIFIEKLNNKLIRK